MLPANRQLAASAYWLSKTALLTSNALPNHVPIVSGPTDIRGRR
jgi:hypothetical protein